ncbi:MAG: ABC transporter permease [Clostridiales bacterium]
MKNRLLIALKADIIFQYKQGFYLVYFIISVLYLIILSQLPQSVVKYILPIILYTDPSVLGLFFIGGILLLEKEQGILSLIYVTPLRIWEFIVSKLSALCLISLFAVLSISLISYHDTTNYFLLILGVILTSILYTTFGFIIATKSKSVNDFFVRMVPQMIVFIAPCIVMFFYPEFKLLNIIPSVASIRLIWGAYHGMGLLEAIFCLLYLCILIGFFINYTYKTFRDNMVIEG